MSEPLLIQGFLALVGGTATVVVVASCWNGFQQWKQTKEYERHTDLLVRILWEVRLLRRRGIKRGTG